MPNLKLAVDLADTVEKAGEQNMRLDIDAAAEELLERHPEAQATRAEVVSALAEEAEATAEGS